MKKRIFSILLLFCLCLSLLPISALATDTDSIVIFHTNDVHTYIDGDITYSKVATLKNSYSDALLF